MIAARWAAVGALVFIALIIAGAVRGQSPELSRAVVVQFLSQKGFVAGQTVHLDRPYTLKSVSITAHGGGEFTVRFRAQ